jgi:hypothetical protein
MSAANPTTVLSRPIRGGATPPVEAPSRPALWRRFYLAGQLALVAGVELSDDMLHAVFPHTNAARGLADARLVVNFERASGFWAEPGIQSFAARTHQVLGQTIGWTQVQPVVNTLYGPGHVLFTMAFAIWIYFCRRPLFSFLRNIFLLSTVLAVALYEIFPLAPPRLAQGLTYQGKPYHFLDPIFGAGGVKVGFNEYAAMPSLHVAWALIVGITLAWVARPLFVRLLGAMYPVVMLLTVIITGNHYLADGIGAAAVVCVATALALLLASRRAAAASPDESIRRPAQLRYMVRQGESNQSADTTDAGSQDVQSEQTAA